MRLEAGGEERSQPGNAGTRKVVEKLRVEVVGTRALANFGAADCLVDFCFCKVLAEVQIMISADGACQADFRSRLTARVNSLSGREKVPLDRRHCTIWLGVTGDNTLVDVDFLPGVPCLSASVLHIGVVNGR